jgi:hypothetical protein
MLSHSRRGEQPIATTIICHRSNSTSSFGLIRRDAYTGGSIGRLYGSVLKFDPEDPAQGVVFVSEDGTETRAAIYSQVTLKQVHFLIPAERTGPQRLVVRAQPRFAPEIREGALSEVLEAV